MRGRASRSAETAGEVEPQRYRGKTLDERKALRREALITAAADLYGEYGYRNVTVRMICLRASLTERYFYEAFGSNEEILVVAARTLARRTLEHMRRLSENVDGDREAKTVRMLEGYYRLQLKEPLKARAFTLEFRGVSAAADREFEAILDSFARLIVDIRDPKHLGRAASDELLRRGLVGGILAITIAWIEGGYRQAIADVVAAAATLCRIMDRD